MTISDPLAEVRAEFAAGLGRRIETIRTALGRLEGDFPIDEAEVLYRTAHSLSGTAASFGAQGLVQPASDLESLARGWLARFSHFIRYKSNPSHGSPNARMY